MLCQSMFHKYDYRLRLPAANANSEQKWSNSSLETTRNLHADLDETAYITGMARIYVSHIYR